MSKRMMTKSDCSGCYDDVYSHGCSGATECWNFKSAVKDGLIDIILVSIDEVPPHRGKPSKRPKCYRKQRYARYRPDQLQNGYVKGFGRY